MSLVIWYKLVKISENKLVTWAPFINRTKTDQREYQCESCKYFIVFEAMTHIHNGWLVSAVGDRSINLDYTSKEYKKMALDFCPICRQDVLKVLEIGKRYLCKSCDLIISTENSASFEPHSCVGYDMFFMLVILLAL